MTDEPIADDPRARSSETRPGNVPVSAVSDPEVTWRPRRESLSVIDVVGRFAALPLMTALRRALLLSLPLVLVGAFAHFIDALVSLPFADGLPSRVSNAVHSICGITIEGTFGLVALVAVLGFPYSFASLTGMKSDRYPVNPAGASMVALSCFFIMVAPDTIDRWREALSSTHGLPAALAVAIGSSCLFLFLARRSRFRFRLRGFGADPLVGDLFSILPAAVSTIAVFAMIRQAQLELGVPGLTTALSSAISAPFVGAEPSALTVATYSMLSQAIWFLGGHGANMMGAALHQIVASAGEAAANAVGSPHVLTANFFPIYSAFGGAGSTLCLIIALLFADREPSIRRLAWLSLLPALVNVNEPLLFGLPVILNPVYVIPFILSPVILSLLGYFATIAGFVPALEHAVPWTMPPLLNGYLAAGSSAGPILQVILLAVGTAFYLPFVRIAARLRLAENAKAMSVLLVASDSDETTGGFKLIDLPGTPGRFAGTLASDLSESLRSADQLYLQYQPQVCIEERRVFGVEALLRWDHEVYGSIPPPITVALAEDMGLIDQLGNYVLRLACRQRVAWGGGVPADLIVSVNVSPHQLLDPNFDRVVLDILTEEGLKPSLLELEITESTSLVPAVRALEALLRLRNAGVRIALDDFGMGHTSLHYLRELPLDTLKIDRSLTFTSQGDLNEHVIRSIVALSRTLGLRAVVEGIEQPEQLPKFIDLGCGRFQGYLFSPPLGSGPCLEYIRANAGAA